MAEILKIVYVFIILLSLIMVVTSQHKQKNLIFFVSKYKQKRPNFILLLCFFKQIIFSNVKLNACCIQFVSFFIFSIIFNQ